MKSADRASLSRMGHTAARYLADREADRYAVRLATQTGFVLIGRTRYFQVQGDFTYCFRAYERAQRYNRLLGWWSLAFLRNFVALSQNRRAAAELCSHRLDHGVERQGAVIDVSRS